MTGKARHSFWYVAWSAFLNAYHLIISAGVATLAWLIAYAYGNDPDIVEAAWVFFCAMGIMFHAENLSETYHDQRAVMKHPSSTEADRRNVGDHIRGEWMRITVKTLFIVSGFVSLYFPPRIGDFNDALRLISLCCLMGGVCILDLDAVLDKITRRQLIDLILKEINERPYGLTAEDRLRQAIEAARDMFHDMNGELAIIVPLLEAMQRDGIAIDGFSIGEMIGSLDAMQSEIRAAHAVIRS